MLRSFFIYLSKASWAQNWIMRLPFAWRMASRFVAGTAKEDAIRVIRELNARGINATLDHLGEHTTNVEEALEATRHILEILEEIERAAVRSNVSIKLTQIGLALDTELCAENLERILRQAQAHNNFVRIDMEDTPYTDATFDLYRRMRQRGFQNFGLVIQSYLYRSEDDVRRLLPEGVPIRLVKGAYKEPPDKAFPKKADVDANYDLLTKLLLDASLSQSSRLSADGRFPPLAAIATHDEKRIEFARRYAERIGLPKEGLEFQMLYGIRRDLQERLAAEGYPVRVYVPYGTHWYPYFMRRLAERPANVWFLLSNLLRG
ncbi:MAG: proline dehydrogenase family protein [Anaerolineales bacterium]